MASPVLSDLAEALAATHHSERMHLLLQRAEEERDLEWLECSLQSAVSVEFSTIPPYLCALWSIKDERHEVAASIRNVVQEEMLHMALACNMLTAIGCIPRISDPNMVPSYPGKIPGGVHPELTVSLSGLTDAALDVFIEIEAPSVGDPPESPEQAKGYKTIGAFYEAIRAAFANMQPKLSTDRQVTGPLSYMVMEDLTAVGQAIDLILAQGEGSEAPPNIQNTHELSHYHRFLNIRDSMERPESWPMAVVPAGGYLQGQVSADVWRMINGFDQTFTQLLDRLQVVWEHGDQGALVHAIETMFGLSEQARALMSMEIEAGRGNYGPCFRFLAERAES